MTTVSSTTKPLRAATSSTHDRRKGGKRMDYRDMLGPVLQALQWQGDQHRLEQIMYNEEVIDDVHRFRDVMACLGYRTTLWQGSLVQLDEEHYPVVVFDRKMHPHLLDKASQALAGRRRKYLILSFQEMTEEKKMRGEEGIFQKLKRFKPQLGQITLLSLAIGVISLAPTFYSFSVYDHVITTGSISSLPALTSGVVLALAAEIILRHVRNRRLGYFGARMDHYISNSVFERLMFLPPIYSERAPVSAQLSRLRDFEAVREFFTGPLSSLFFELPLIFLYIGIMAAIGGMLALTPVCLVVAYGMLLWQMHGRLRETSRRSAEASSARQEFMLETLTKLRAIRLNGMGRIWAGKYRQLSKNAAFASFDAMHAAHIVEITSYILMVLGAVATLTFGVEQVIQQTMTIGALIASMMLIWRIVAPLQMCCASVTRIQQLKDSTKQVLRLLDLSTEHNPYLSTPNLDIQGRITFSRVSMRYLADAEPALLGVSFDIEPGQVVAIRGNNGSGKTSILKLVLGLYQPQSGAVRLDGMDVRQFDPVALRQSVSYVPQTMELMPGTLRDNLRFANPLADDAQCRAALDAVCALEEVDRLSDGLDTVVAGEGAEEISFLLKQQLNIARAYLKPAKIMLLDEASHSLGKQNDEAFVRMINNFRGRRTILMVTHREDHLRLADQVLTMEKGELLQMSKQDVQSLLSRKGNIQ